MTLPENLKFLYQACQTADSEKQQTLVLWAIPKETYASKQIMTIFYIKF